MTQTYRIAFEVIKSGILDSSDISIDDISFIAGVSCAGDLNERFAKSSTVENHLSKFQNPKTAKIRKYFIIMFFFVQ